MPSGNRKDDQPTSLPAIPETARWPDPADQQRGPLDIRLSSPGTIQISFRACRAARKHWPENSHASPAASERTRHDSGLDEGTRQPGSARANDPFPPGAFSIAPPEWDDTAGAQ